MKPQTSREFPWQLVILLVTLAAIAWIYQSAAVDNTVILPLIGGACLVMGLITLRRELAQKHQTTRQTVLQCTMGAVILLIGVIECFQIELPQAAWYGLLAVILLISVLFGRFRRRK